MKVVICILSALVVAVYAVGERTDIAETCYPEVPERCPREDPIEECPTCCCNSTANVEFYNPDAPEPECTAPPAIYEMKFVFTWSAICHPDYYFDESKWSPPTGASHTPGYRMWDACMDNASPGVGLVSRTGNTSVINQEYMEAMEYILDTTEGELVPSGSGMTSSNLIVDNNHQYVSAISMLVPSPDRLVGVADLRLCDGSGWRDSVQVCFELFSTATATEKVVPEMERNSLQNMNCSFGYVQFNFLRTVPRTVLADACSPEVPERCPREDPIEECPTCCCDSTDNVEFYNPDAEEPECTAPPAIYEMKFVFTWSSVCHPDYYFPDESKWSPPTGASHNPGYRMWDACMDNASPGVGLVSRTGNTSVINQEYMAAMQYILDTTEGELVPSGSGMTSSNLIVNKYHQYVSAISMLVPSPDRLVGVADLRLCDGSGWRDSVQVCFELFSTATASDKVVAEMERNSLQSMNCSFGYVQFNLLRTVTDEPRTDLADACSPEVPERCPREEPIEECDTCCCDSTANVEFYDPDADEPECTATATALYEMRFTFTWSAVCHPDYYFPNAKWSPPTGASHTPGYRMWDACMDNASPGVGLVSQTGDTSAIKQEYIFVGEKIFNMTQGQLVTEGSGTTAANITLDQEHQYVSAISMLVPSPDRLVGVADLRLCNGDEWRESVRVCFELFSTATATEKVVPEMERNSLQSMNCSFGYVEFTLLSGSPKVTGTLSAVFAALAFATVVIQMM